MQAQIRRPRTARIHDQENVYTTRGKATILPANCKGLTVRGALGELTNIQAQQEVNVGKVAETTAEFEKKVSACRGTVKSNYSHVQSRVDTGLSVKSQISTISTERHPLRREESTAGLACKAIARTRSALKDSKSGTSESKNITQTKKNESKKIIKLPTATQNKEQKNVVRIKPILKESTESLGKLKLDEKLTSLINLENLPKPSSLHQPSLDDSFELPEDIEDIDNNENQNVILNMPIYIKDIYRYLRELEDKYRVEPEHLKEQIAVTGKMRATLIDWLVDVHRQFSLVLETFQLTVGIIDRYLQAVPTVQRNQLQLVGVAAMYIAAKYEEIYAPEVGDFVYVTDKAYSKADIFQCERDIMSKLDFCLARPIPLCFLRRYIKAAHGSSKNHHLAKYFVDLSLIEYSMAHYRPSELAAAALCLSLYILSTEELEEVWTSTLAYYSGYTLDAIEPILRKIAKIVINIDNSKNQAVYNKYLDPTLAKVAGLPQLKSKRMYEIAQLDSTS